MIKSDFIFQLIRQHFNCNIFCFQISFLVSYSVKNVFQAVIFLNFLDLQNNSQFIKIIFNFFIFDRIFIFFLLYFIFVFLNNDFTFLIKSFIIIIARLFNNLILTKKFNGQLNFIIKSILLLHLILNSQLLPFHV